MKSYRAIWSAIGMLVGGLLGGAAFAEEIIYSTTDTVDVNVQVAPTASIQIIGGSLLYLRIPPPGSTIPSNGVNFKITGNAHATVTAEPDDFVTIPTFDYPGGEAMGRAVLNGNPVGYRIRLDFPSAALPGSPIQLASLPGYAAGPTEPPLSVNLMPSGARNGRIHLEASPEWTPTGGLPLPGIYVGGVIITVSAY